MNNYFATSERSPKKDPIVFWTTGGPGPFKIEEDLDYIISGVKVELNPFCWTKDDEYPMHSLQYDLLSR
ncbi:hypothetical protein AMTRI_Chr06g197680 [Amborella trichopoda]